MKVDRIDVRTVDGWVNLLRDPEYIKAQTQKRINYSHEFDLFRNILNYYVEFENEEFRVPLLNRHRKRLCSRPKHLRNEIKFLRPDQFDDLLLSLNNFKGSPKEMVLAKLMRFQLETGLRIGEAAALEYHQIVFSRKEVIISQRLQWDRAKEGKINVAPGTKGGPSRIVYMSRTCEAILRELHSSKTCSKVFNHDDRWIPFRKIQHFYGKLLREVGASSLGTHTLRHTFAVNFLKKTKDMHALQKLLGHASLEMTQVYAKYSDESTRRSFEVFSGNVLEVDFKDLAHKSGSHR